MTALQKAQAALDRGKTLQEEHGGAMPPEIDRVYVELLAIAGTQANIACAEALERVAVATERQADALSTLAGAVGARFD